MTAKSRRRKLDHKLNHSQPSLGTFRFFQGSMAITIKAENEELARKIFQDTYGYEPA